MEADKKFLLITISSISLVVATVYGTSLMKTSQIIRSVGRIFVSENLALYKNYECTEPPLNETWGEIPKESNSTALKFYLKNIGDYTITELEIIVMLWEEYIDLRPYLHFHQSFYDFQYGNWNGRRVHMEPGEVVEFYIVCEVEPDCPKGDFAVDIWVIEVNRE